MRFLSCLFISLLICSYALNTSLNLRKSTQDFSKSCWDYQLHSEKPNVLIGKCRSIRGKIYGTQIDLNKCLSNNDGNFQWKADGKYLGSSKECKLNGSVLSCGLRTKRGSWVTRSIDLDDNISNDDAAFVCEVNKASREDIYQ